MEIFTKSAQETQKLGEKLANQLTINHKQSLLLRNQPLIIALTGELGSGKTTFIQGLAKGLGIKKRIISPTFVFIRQYPVTDHRSLITFYHIDLYRIDKIEDTRGLGLEEIFSDPENVVAIEWAEKIKKILPKKRWDIYFKYVSENERRIIIND